MFWTGVVIGMIAGIVIGGTVGTVVVALTRAARDRELGQSAWELEREVWLRDRERFLPGGAIPPASTLFGYRLDDLRWMVGICEAKGWVPGKQEGA